MMQNTGDKHTHETQPLPLSASQHEVHEEAVLDQDQVLTPRPFAVPQNELPPPERNRYSAEPSPRFASKALWIVAILALLVSLVSLALNAVLITRLLEARQMVVEGLDAAIAALDKLEERGFHYEYHFAETIPFSGDIPFKQDMVFPFKGDIPINTVVKVPIDTGVLGQFTIDVPINTSFYVDLEVPISVDQTIHVDTEIPLDMVIPIDVKLDDPVIAGQLDQIRAWLIGLRESF
jgi:hypothetical protein